MLLPRPPRIIHRGADNCTHKQCSEIDTNTLLTSPRDSASLHLQSHNPFIRSVVANNLLVVASNNSSQRLQSAPPPPLRGEH